MTMNPINGIIIAIPSTRLLFAAGFFNRGKLRHPKDSSRPYVRYNLSYQVEPPSRREPVRVTLESAVDIL